MTDEECIKFIMEKKGVGRSEAEEMLHSIYSLFHIAIEHTQGQQNKPPE